MFGYPGVLQAMGGGEHMFSLKLMELNRRLCSRVEGQCLQNKGRDSVHYCLRSS